MEKLKTVELPHGAIMNEELANKEVDNWFDFRKMKGKARINIDEDLGRDVMRDKLVEGFMYGNLTFNPENGNLIQKLDFPIQNESKSVNVDKLEWKPRFRESDLTEPMKGIKTNDSSGRMKAYMSAITGVSRQHLGSMDYSDYSLSQTIVSYFLL